MRRTKMVLWIRALQLLASTVVAVFAADLTIGISRPATSRVAAWYPYAGVAGIAKSTAYDDFNGVRWLQWRQMGLTEDHLRCTSNT